MKNYLLFLLCLLGWQMGNAQLSGSYTVDPNSAASSSNYQDLISAVFDLTQSSGNRPDGGTRNGPGVNGAVTFTIEPGTYSGQLLLTPISGSSSSNTITFVSAGNSTKSVIITDSATSASNNGTIRISGASYITFSHVWVKVKNKSYSGFGTDIIIDSSGSDVSSNILFYGCRFESGWYITNKNLSNVYINGYQSDISFVKDTFYNASCGLYVDGNRNFGDYTPNLTVDSCAFPKVSGFSDCFQPFYLRYIKNLKISHTYVIKTGCCADRMGTMYGLRGPVEISYNKFYYESSAGNGIEMDSVNLYNDNAEALIYNNFFQSNYTGSGNLLRLSRAAYTKIVFNNFYSNGGSSAYNCIETNVTDTNVQQGNELINNMFISNAGVMINSLGSSQRHAVNFFDRINYNNYWRPNSTYQTLFSIYGTKYNSTSSVIDAYYPGSDSASTFSRAQYAGTNNLYLKNTSCMLGTDINYITDDIDGTARNSPPVIGAHESAGGSIGNDIGIVSILSPSSSTYSAGSYDLKVLVKNYGKNSVTSFNIKYQLNNGSIVTETFSGNLSTCDTVTMTFSGSNQLTLSSGSYYLKIYTDSVNAGIDSLRTNDTVETTYCTPLSGNYTIDPSSSLSSTNFQNFNQFVSTVNSCGQSGPVYVSVSSGTYNEHLLFGTISGNDTTNNIIIDGGNASSTVLHGKSYNGSRNFLVRLDGVKGIEFRNITFRSDSSTMGYLMQCMSGTKLRFAKNIFEFTGNAANTANPNQIGILVTGSYTGNSNVSIPIIEIDSNTFNNGYYAIQFYLSSYTNVISIRNNTIVNPYYSAVYGITGTFKIIGNNIKMRGTNSYYGVFLINNSPYNSAYYNQFNDNIMTNLGTYGVYLSSSNGGYNNQRGEFYNNMIGGKFNGTGSVTGVALNYSNNWDFFHNTIALSSVKGSSHRCLNVQGSGNYNNQFINNNFTIDTTANNAICVEFSQTTLAASAGVDYNNYYNYAGGDYLTIAGTNYNSSNYNGSFPSGGGASSVDGAVTYTSVGDLHVSGSQLGDRGLPVTVYYDIDGDPRSSTTPDIGADEYNSINNHDLMISKLVNPVNQTCAGGYNQLVTIEIKNPGIDTIDLTNDTAWVSLKSEDPYNNISNFGPLPLTGVIFYPTDKMNFDISATFDMSESGYYYFTPYIKWASDSNQNNDTLKNQMRNSTNPVPVFSPYGKTSICNNDSIKLSLANSKNTVDFAWYYNGQLTSIFDSVIYAAAPGTYYCEIANYLCNAFSDTITITAGAKPNSVINSGNTTICANDSTPIYTNFNATYTYQWFKNGTAIQGATDTIIYVKSQGNYSILVTDAASGCDSISSAISITVNQGPGSGLTYSGNGIFCMGDSLKITAEAGHTSYQWYEGSNILTGKNDSFIYVYATGNYSVEISGSNGCKTLTSTVSVTADSLPSSAVSVAGNINACGSDSIIMDAVVGFTYQWMENGSNINGATSQQYITQSNGIYTVKVTNSNGCFSVSQPITVSFRIQPGLPDVYGLTSTICPTDSTKLGVNVSDTGLFTYNWKLNGINITGKTDSILYAASAGTYTIEITNNAGCSSVSNPGFDVSVANTSIPVLTATGNTTFCLGDSVLLTVTNSAGMNSINWLKDGNSLTATTNSLYINSTGNYSVKVADTIGCKTQSNTVAVTVNPLPVPVIIENLGASELSTGTFVTYQWYLNGTPISGATTQKIRIFGNGTYTVEVTDGNGCKGMSATKNVTWYIGIRESETTALSVYPNPTQSTITVRGIPVGTHLQITDVTGRKFNTPISISGQQLTIDLQSLPAGIYFLQVSSLRTPIKVVKE